MSELHHIPVLLKNGTLDTLVLEVACKPPWKLIVSGMHFDNKEFQAKDLFEALINLRIELETHNSQLLCNGARIDVFPSGMARSMGSARKAYWTIMGEPAIDLVDIFDRTELGSTGTVRQQQEYHKRWIQSLGK